MSPEPKPNAPQKYERAWLVPSPDGGEPAVLVAAGREKDPYWWVLCPASATLYLDGVEGGAGSCSIGIECDFDELHDAASRLYKELTDG